MPMRLPGTGVPARRERPLPAAQNAATRAIWARRLPASCLRACCVMECVMGISVMTPASCIK